MRAIILGTGPSVTPQVLAEINASDLLVFGCNNTYTDVDLFALYACNWEWWEHYWPIDEQLRSGAFQKWTYHKPTADKYGLSYVAGRWEPGLSTDPNYIHWGHGSGYEQLGIAYNAGVREMILCGYDIRYPAGYNGITQTLPAPRRYYGEYPKELQHWTKFNIGAEGELNGLLDCYRTIDCKALGLRIINTNPDSALDFFEMDENAIC